MVLIENPQGTVDLKKQDTFVLVAQKDMCTKPKILDMRICSAKED